MSHKPTLCDGFGEGVHRDVAAKPQRLWESPQVFREPRPTGPFRAANLVIKSIISRCAGVFRSRNSSSEWVSVNLLSLTSALTRSRRLSFSSEERRVKSIFASSPLRNRDRLNDGGRYRNAEKKVVR
jgi:hypothetical protein